MMDIGSVTLCVTIGTLICLIFFGMGVCIGNARDHKKQFDADNDVRIYVFSRYRDRSGDQRGGKPSYEEMTLVLQNVKRSTTGHEREVMDAIEEVIKERASRDVNT